MLPADRFLAKADRSGECWLWTGYLNAWGYGRFYVDGRGFTAHRWAYEQWVGPIPDGYEVDHLCRVRSCVNPAHLEAVTHQENVLRGESEAARHARAETCPAGHPYDEVNTYVCTRGRRNCRVCRKQQYRDHINRKRELALANQ